MDVGVLESEGAWHSWQGSLCMDQARPGGLQGKTISPHVGAAALCTCWHAIGVGPCPRAAVPQPAPYDGGPVGVGESEARHGAERHL